MNPVTSPKKKMKTWKKVLLIVIIALLGLLIAAGITVFAVINHYLNMIPRQDIDDPADTFISITDETDFPDIPATPSGTSGTSTQRPVVSPSDPVVTNENVTTPPIVSMPTSELEAIESEVKEAGSSKTPLMEFDKNITNILLIGTDGRSVSERGRSDSMILLSINKNTKQIVMTSIMRDIYLSIPGLSQGNRINAAYSAGGVSLLLKTIENNFRIKIDKYVRINFFGFEKVINRLGGLDIRLSQAEINFVGMQNTATPGIVHMNGAQVLKFCRCRYVSRDGYGSDFARTYRQREVMTLIANKMKGASLSTLDDLLKEFLPQVVTNLDNSEMMDLLFNFNNYMDNYEIKSYQIPASGTWRYATIRKMSVLSIDFKKNIKALESYIKGTA